MQNLMISVGVGLVALFVAAKLGMTAEACYLVAGVLFGWVLRSLAVSDRELEIE